MLAGHQRFRAHAFNLACAQLHIEHRLTKFDHLWTSGQVERMTRTIKDATVRRFYYETHESLRAHGATFLDAYNFAKRLKSLRGLNPLERICQCWTEEPETYRLNPVYHIAGGTEHLASAEMNSISRDSIVAEADKVGKRIWNQVLAAGAVRVPRLPRQD
jgi:hypothetical protein